MKEVINMDFSKIQDIIIPTDKNIVSLFDGIVYLWRKNKIDINFIDLGLPSGTLWADRNVGADNESSFGNYFAWGETESKKEYSLDTYSFYDGSSFTKYTINDKLDIIELSDDAACKTYGYEYNIPSKAEIEELINPEYTSIQWVNNYNDILGINGILITSNINGNQIFLPAMGLASENSIVLTGTNGCYWSS